eukprot:Plantae.Rhodophyta-Hildenbrandia_rubra.ctg20811.p1 GENE.Plantae.Rhodophyta-Hildenbrandia_rubra.ctg20811~~Plantae.Rhodophyta-Hildenbrandia_rubra.ctg20811.p1  ORF type:complete len:848 (-),score=175.42 Plantae.Rhodophyta-Hildenbrandia_rubra.ctg20811:2117-4660(-)
MEEPFFPEGLPATHIPVKNIYKAPRWIGKSQETVRIRVLDIEGNEDGFIIFYPDIPYILFGRDPCASHFFIGHPSVNRQHAVVEFHDRYKTCFLTDLGSKGGTLVNGVALVPNTPTQLYFGSKFRFAQSNRTFVFEAHPDKEDDGNLIQHYPPHLKEKLPLVSPKDVYGKGKGVRVNGVNERRKDREANVEKDVEQNDNDMEIELESARDMERVIRRGWEKRKERENKKEREREREKQQREREREREIWKNVDTRIDEEDTRPPTATNTIREKIRATKENEALRRGGPVVQRGTRPIPAWLKEANIENGRDTRRESEAAPASSPVQRGNELLAEEYLSTARKRREWASRSAVLTTSPVTNGSDGDPYTDTNGIANGYIEKELPRSPVQLRAVPYQSPARKLTSVPADDINSPTGIQNTRMLESDVMDLDDGTALLDEFPPLDWTPLDDADKEKDIVMDSQRRVDELPFSRPEDLPVPDDDGLFDNDDGDSDIEVVAIRRKPAARELVNGNGVPHISRVTPTSNGFRTTGENEVERRTTDAGEKRRGRRGRRSREKHLERRREREEERERERERERKREKERRRKTHRDAAEYLASRRLDTDERGGGDSCSPLGGEDDIRTAGRVRMSRAERDDGASRRLEELEEARRRHRKRLEEDTLLRKSRRSAPSTNGRKTGQKGTLIYNCELGQYQVVEGLKVVEDRVEKYTATGNKQSVRKLVPARTDTRDVYNGRERREARSTRNGLRGGGAEIRRSKGKDRSRPGGNGDRGRTGLRGSLRKPVANGGVSKSRSSKGRERRTQRVAVGSGYKGRLVNGHVAADPPAEYKDIDTPDKGVEKLAWWESYGLSV